LTETKAHLMIKNPYREKQSRKFDAILMAIKKNFILEANPDDDFYSKKAMEGTKTLPYLVMLFLIREYDLPVDFMYSHFYMTDKRMAEIDERLSLALHRNDVKLITKIKLCKNWIKFNFK